MVYTTALSVVQINNVSREGLQKYVKNHTVKGYSQKVHLKISLVLLSGLLA